MIDLDYYRTVVETQYTVEILRAELLDLITECDRLKWIKVEDRFPLQDAKYKGVRGVCNKYLVTVELKDKDPNDDPEVMFLWFTTPANVFSLQPGGKPYEEEIYDWYVVAWAECPKPYLTKE